MSDLHNLMMVDHIQEKLEMGRKHLDHYRREGLRMPPDEKRDDEMKVLATGDVHFTTTNTQPSTPQKASGTIGKVLAGAALAAGLIGIPGAGIAGYFLSKLTDKPAVTQPTTDDTVDIGLKRIGDLIGGGK